MLTKLVVRPARSKAKTVVSSSAFGCYKNADTNRPAGTAVTKPRARHGELASLLQPWESRERRFDSHEVAALKGERDGASSMAPRITCLA